MLEVLSLEAPGLQLLEVLLLEAPGLQLLEFPCLGPLGSWGWLEPRLQRSRAGCHCPLRAPHTERWMCMRP